jgi:hypothetical protein
MLPGRVCGLGEEEGVCVVGRALSWILEDSRISVLGGDFSLGKGELRGGWNSLWPDESEVTNSPLGLPVSLRGIFT